MQKKNRGMTLIEVLVAFIVLSLTMAVILQIFSVGMRNARVAESYSRAVFLAESRLAAIGAEQPLAPAEDNGQVGANLRWSVAVVPVDDNGVADQLVMPVRLFRIRVRVGWSEDGRERQIELRSLRVGSR
jgi:general secretion pathway protein I